MDNKGEHNSGGEEFQEIDKYGFDELVSKDGTFFNTIDGNSSLVEVSRLDISDILNIGDIEHQLELNNYTTRDIDMFERLVATWKLSKYDEKRLKRYLNTYSDKNYQMLSNFAHELSLMYLVVGVERKINPTFDRSEVRSLVQAMREKRIDPLVRIELFHDYVEHDKYNLLDMLQINSAGTIKEHRLNEYKSFDKYTIKHFEKFTEVFSLRRDLEYNNKWLGSFMGSFSEDYWRNMYDIAHDMLGIVENEDYTGKLPQIYTVESLDMFLKVMYSLEDKRKKIKFEQVDNSPGGKINVVLSQIRLKYPKIDAEMYDEMKISLESDLEYIIENSTAEIEKGLLKDFKEELLDYEYDLIHEMIEHISNYSEDSIDDLKIVEQYVEEKKENLLATSSEPLQELIGLLEEHYLSCKATKIVAEIYQNKLQDEESDENLL